MKRISSFSLIVACITSKAFGLTIILDFNDPNQGNTTDRFNNVVGTFSVTEYGFAEADRNSVYNGIYNTVVGHYHNIDLGAVDIAQAGRMLDIDFVIGDSGFAPSNGDLEYYSMQIGSAVTSETSLGTAGLGVIRSSTGTADPFNRGVGAIWGSIFTDNINGLGGVGSQLTSGNTTATYNAIAGTLSHEIGHALSLKHLNKAGSVTPNGLSPLMGTGAIDLPNADRLQNREFSISGFNNQEAGAAQFHIAQLITAVGTRPIPEPSSALLLLVGSAAIIARRRR